MLAGAAGVGTEEDASKGIVWVTRAAENGLNHACYVLGWYYEHGEAGFKQDNEEAEGLGFVAPVLPVPKVIDVFVDVDMPREFFF